MQTVERYGGATPPPGTSGAATAVVGALVRSLAGEPGVAFLRRRAHRELGAIAGTPDEPYLRRLLVLAGASDPGAHRSRIVAQLIGYACELESRHRWSEGLAAVELAIRIHPHDPTASLHAARLARKLGESARARALYAAVAAASGGTHLGRLAAIGAALVDSDVAAVGRAIRAALHAGDAEAAAVGLEERAALRRRAGDRAAAARDLAAAALRYGEPCDRGRVANAVADLLSSDAASAREALLAASVAGEEPQRRIARSRLYALSLATGDRLGARRWRDSRPPLVSLGPAPADEGADARGPGRLRRWRALLEARSARPALAPAPASVQPLGAPARLEG